MADKLDMSLDTIVQDRRKSGRPRRSMRRTTKTTVTPVGGVKKTTKPAKTTDKVAPVGAVLSGESKILVSNLPHDVVEDQIKEYFSKTIGPIKRVWMAYGPNGQSRGSATIVFSKPTSAAEAAKSCDGIKVDGRPMKIEVILGAQQAPAIPAAKSLSDRMDKPKSAAKAQPKPATATKGKKPKPRRGRNAGRAKKTAEELDTEMTDYFKTAPNGEGTAAAQPSGINGGDMGMDDVM